MANIKEKIYAEMENIAKVLIMNNIPKVYSEFKRDIDNYLTKIEE